MLHVGSICGTSVGQLVGPRSHFLLHRYDREPFGYGEDVDDTLNLESKRRDFSRKRMHRRELSRRSENHEGETLRNGGNRVLGPIRVGIAIQDREPIVGVGDRALDTLELRTEETFRAVNYFRVVFGSIEGDGCNDSALLRSLTAVSVSR